MKAKTILKALGTMARQRHFFGKGLIKSYVSLLLVLILGVTSTMAWFSEREAAHLESENLEFQSASSLRINKDKSSTNKITIPAFTLDEASSLDGRNIYFPVDRSFTSNTAEMFFREGNKGDENVHYVYKDFELKGTSGSTPVYIKSYKIVVSTNGTVMNDGIDGIYEDQLEINYNSNGVPQSQKLPPDDCPIRLAFISDSSKTPIVIDPSAQISDRTPVTSGGTTTYPYNYAEDSDAVALIDDNGVATTQRTSNDSFSTYYFKNHPLFTIPGGQNLPVTLVVWLEGTMGNCDRYIGKKISIDIDIESNFAEMEDITFIDDTAGDSGSGGHWIGNDNPIIACSYEDPFSEETPKRWKTVMMTRKSNNSSSPDYYKWTCRIPKKAVQNISFYRLSKATDKPGEPQGTIYNAWHTSPNIGSMISSANIQNSWYQSGRFDLQQTRQKTDDYGNHYNSVVYTAVHGNGHSITSDPKKRLSPCVGYWDYGSSVTPTPTQAPATESGGGGGGGTTAQIGVFVNTGEQTWIDNNCRPGNNHLYFKTANGEKKELTLIGSNYFSWSGPLAVGDEITVFTIEDNIGTQYRSWDASPTFEVTSEMVGGGWNVTYSVNRDNTKMTR